MKSEKGFTIIELMIVVAIIGILTSLAIPAYQAYRVKSYDTAAVTDARNLATFESQFYNEFFEYVPLVPGDKAANGAISKSVTLKNGDTQLFTLNVLTPNLQVAVNTDADNQSAIIAVHHPGGAHIIAIEAEQSTGVRAKPFTGTMTNGDIPASTQGIDLSSWSQWLE